MTTPLGKTSGNVWVSDSGPHKHERNSETEKSQG